jgi:hypothetical protein
MPASHISRAKDIFRQGIQELLPLYPSCKVPFFRAYVTPIVSTMPEDLHELGQPCQTKIQGHGCLACVACRSLLVHLPPVRCNTSLAPTTILGTSRAHCWWPASKRGALNRCPECLQACRWTAKTLGWYWLPGIPGIHHGQSRSTAGHPELLFWIFAGRQAESRSIAMYRWVLAVPNNAGKTWERCSRHWCTTLQGSCCKVPCAKLKNLVQPFLMPHSLTHLIQYYQLGRTQATHP